MFQPEERRVQTSVDDPAWVSQGPPLRRRLLSVMLQLVLEEKEVWAMCWLDRLHDRRPLTPRFQCNVDKNPSAQSRRTPCCTHQNCVTLDQGIALGLAYAVLFKWVLGGPLAIELCETLQSAQTPLLGAWQASSTLQMCRTRGGRRTSMGTILRGWLPFTATRRGN